MSNYTVKMPNSADFVQSLTAIFGREKAIDVFNQAKKHCNISNANMSFEELEKVALFLASQKNLVSVAANSLLIKMRSYKSLTTLKR